MMLRDCVRCCKRRFSKVVFHPDVANELVCAECVLPADELIEFPARVHCPVRFHWEEHVRDKRQNKPVRTAAQVKATNQRERNKRKKNGRYKYYLLEAA